MTDAKEIIATAYIEGRTEPVGPLHAQAILAALTAAGFHIVGPEEVDPVTVEKCDGQACYYYGCQHLPGCALKEKQR